MLARFNSVRFTLHYLHDLDFRLDFLMGLLVEQRIIPFSLEIVKDAFWGLASSVGSHVVYDVRNLHGYCFLVADTPF